MQTRKQSLVETVVGTVVAFLLSMVVSHYLYPVFGFRPTLAENFGLTLIFTVVSIIRSYVVRRIFNRLHAPGTCKGVLAPALAKISAWWGAAAPGLASYAGHGWAPPMRSPPSVPPLGCQGCARTRSVLHDMWNAHGGAKTCSGFCPTCGTLQSLKPHSQGTP